MLSAISYLGARLCAELCFFIHGCTVLLHSHHMLGYFREARLLCLNYLPESNE